MYQSSEHIQFLFIYSVIYINMDSGYFILWAIIYYCYILFRLLRFALRIPCRLAHVPFCYDPIIF